MLREKFCQVAYNKKNQVVLLRREVNYPYWHLELMARLLPRDWKPGKPTDLIEGVGPKDSPYLEVPLTPAERDDPGNAAVTSATRKVKFFRTADAVVSFLMDVGENARCMPVQRLVIDAADELQMLVLDEIHPLCKEHPMARSTKIVPDVETFAVEAD